jgi:hypothetical protein
MRRADIYLRRGRFIIHASSETTAGLWILAEPVIGLEEACSDAELVRAISAAIDGSRRGVQHPVVWDSMFAPVLQLAGVKTWPTFVKGAARIALSQIDRKLTIMPTRNLGAKDGYDDAAAHMLVVDSDDVAAVALAARKALALSAGL